MCSSIRTAGLLAILLGTAGALGLSGCVAAVGAGAAAGVAIHQDRRTTGTLVDDQLIEFKALAAIGGDEELSEQSHISTTSVNGAVLLTGETTSETLRRRAVARVGAVEKVRKVHDELTIAAPASMLSRSNDTWLTGKVKTALLGADAALATRVKVVTDKGVVYLMGLLSRTEADAVTEVARRVDGVQRVVRVFEYRR